MFQLVFNQFLNKYIANFDRDKEVKIFKNGQRENEEKTYWSICVRSNSKVTKIIVLTIGT